MTYRTTDLDGDFRRNPKTDCFCARCQKDLKVNQPRRWVHLVDGGAVVLHPEDEDIFNADPANAAGDFHWLPVGMDCARKIGLEFTLAEPPNLSQTESPVASDGFPRI